AALLTLDALGDDPIELRIDAPDGSLDAAFSLIDVIGTLHVEVRTVGLGLVGGPAVGVLACGRDRSLSPHARVRLAEPRTEVAGRASDIQAAVAEHQRQLERFNRHLAAASGQPLEHIEADMQQGRYLDAEQALAYGLVDRVLGPGGTR
ncbi:MAG TPA: ATP-dependent Clp protease proteolytic subunit, partial [Acidimicrobiales bacterium]|nr:ATP-dependent Clp protease proteolytic subunit [Acidimicrobiales bacterium]